MCRDNYMLINSYLTFCFLLFAFCFFSMTALLQLGVYAKKVLGEMCKECDVCKKAIEINCEWNTKL